MNKRKKPLWSFAVLMGLIILWLVIVYEVFSGMM